MHGNACKSVPATLNQEVTRQSQRCQHSHCSNPAGVKPWSAVPTQPSANPAIILSRSAVPTQPQHKSRLPTICPPRQLPAGPEEASRARDQATQEHAEIMRCAHAQMARAPALLRTGKCFCTANMGTQVPRSPPKQAIIPSLEVRGLLVAVHLSKPTPHSPPSLLLAGGQTLEQVHSAATVYHTCTTMNATPEPAPMAMPTPSGYWSGAAFRPQPYLRISTSCLTLIQLSFLGHPPCCKWMLASL